MAKVNFEYIVGKTFAKVVNGHYEIHFTENDGTEYMMLHHQDCCESVSVEDISGDLEWLCDTPILIAEESSSTESTDPNHKYCESETWTFYRIITAKGLVVIRWYGSSNGYYSESVSFIKL